MSLKIKNLNTPIILYALPINHDEQNLRYNEKLFGLNQIEEFGLKFFFKPEF